MEKDMYEAEQRALVGAQIGGGLAGTVIGQPASMTEKLRAHKARLETELRHVNEAIDALESDEKIARAVDAITKLGHF